MEYINMEVARAIDFQKFSPLTKGASPNTG